MPEVPRYRDHGCVAVIVLQFFLITFSPALSAGDDTMRA
jgi:hypothetical protein